MIRVTRVEFRGSGIEAPIEEFLGEYQSEYSIVKTYHLTLPEIRWGLESGELIQRKYLLELSPDFLPNEDQLLLIEALHMEAIAEIVDEYGGEVPREDIRRILGLTETMLRKHISNACMKIARHPRAKEFLYNVREYKERKNAMYTVTVTTKITITKE
jgi:hypothetical protein